MKNLNGCQYPSKEISYHQNIHLTQTYSCL